jgi:predicted nucleic acid-binding protein
MIVDANVLIYATERSSPFHRTTNAQLAALAIEHGLPIVSTDADFARFPEIRWINPLASA